MCEDGTCFNLMAMHGHDVHVICFQQNQREEVRSMGEQSGALTAESGMHNTNYLAYAIDHVVTTGGNCTAQGPCWYKNICPTEKASGVHAVCFPNKVISIEGNTVDRASCKNGKGYSENVSPTLNTQDRHAVIYAIDQQGGKGNCSYSENVTPTILSDSHGTPHAICFQLSGDRDNPSVSVSDTAYCISANPMSDRGQAVCHEK